MIANQQMATNIYLQVFVKKSSKDPDNHQNTNIYSILTFFY